MLKPDLVRAQRRDGELRLTKLTGKDRERTVELAAAFLAVARAGIGQTRDELREALAGVAVEARLKRLGDGLRKLVDDASSWAEETDLDPRSVRAAVFTAAAAARRRLGPGEHLDRAAALAAVGRELARPATAIDDALFADLSGAHLLRTVEPMTAEGLVDRYVRGSVQAVLLRAVKLTVEVTCASPAAYRALFHKLKFRRLLHTITDRAAGGYRIEIDGPFSLFESVTKYGLQLALALPALEECDAFELEADLRWGKRREKLRFRHTHRLRGPSSDGTSAPGPPLVNPELARLQQELTERDNGWRAEPAEAIVNLPGVGLCVPDLVCEHAASGARVYVELLGFWSRTSVWQRVELVQQGVTERILFVVSSRLRVSEEVLSDHDGGALYVFKGKLSAAAVEKRLESLRAR